MPKGIRNGEPEDMLDVAAESAHRREVDALMDRLPERCVWSEMELFLPVRQKLRQALVGGNSKAKPRLKQLAADRDAEREARLKSGKPRRARRARRARRRRKPTEATDA